MKNTRQTPILFFCLFILSIGWMSFKTDTPSNQSTKIELQEINNIPYYEDAAMQSDLTQLNLIIPKGVTNPPVFMWIGGGAWAYVNRHQEMNLCRELAKQGILMVSVGHRLSPALLGEPKNPNGIQHPEHIKDVAQAFKWVYDHAKEYGYSTDNIFVGGYSSGAQLAALLAADGRYLKEVGHTTNDIKAILPVAGAYDIPRYRLSLIEEDPSYLENHINAVFGTSPDVLQDASPMHYLDQFITPMLMLSERDTYGYSVLFEQALKEKGQDNYEVLNCHKETHNTLWRKLSAPENCNYRNYMVDYILSMSR